MPLKIRLRMRNPQSARLVGSAASIEITEIEGIEVDGVQQISPECTNASQIIGWADYYIKQLEKIKQQADKYFTKQLK